MGSVSTPRHNPRPDICEPLRIPNHPFVRTKNILPLHSRLVLRCQIAAPAAVNHQYVRNPLCIPNHPIVGAKYFSPRHRPLVARNTLTISALHHFWHARNIFRPYVRHRWRLTISAPHHLWHGRKIFRPYICHCYPVARSPPRPQLIIKIHTNLFASPIIRL